MATDATRKNPADHVAELKDLVVGYAKQETIDPLKTLGRYLGFGVGGAIAIGLGCVFLLLALLRGLQSLDAFDGTGAMSLIPYAAVVVVSLIVIVLAGIRISKDDQPKNTKGTHS